MSAFDTSKFTGDWYISAGLNPIFDTFDCQLHKFEAPAPQEVVGNLTWRIGTPDGGFFTRSAVQKFKQDEQRPGVLLNHGNEFLHYEDDWCAPALPLCFWQSSLMAGTASPACP